MFAIRKQSKARQRAATLRTDQLVAWVQTTADQVARDAHHGDLRSALEGAESLVALLEEMLDR